MKKQSIYLKALACLAILVFAGSCNHNDASKNKHKVSFDTFGGTKIPTQEVETGKTATKPADPVKDNYTFTERWYTIKEGRKGIEDPLHAKPYDFKTPVTTNLNLKAGFLITTLPVEFDANGGGVAIKIPTANATISASKLYSYEDGNTLNAFGQAIKDNMEALKDAKKGNNPFQGFSLKNDAASDADLIISKKAVTSVDNNGFSYASVNAAALFTAKGSFAASDPSPAKLYAAYYPTPSKFSVKFYEEFGKQPPYNQQDILTGGKATKPENPKMDGYTFIDWRTSDEGQKSQYGDPRTSHPYNFDDPVTANVELYAGFLIHILPITFDPNGGSGTLKTTQTTANLVVTEKGPFYPYASNTGLNDFGNALKDNIIALKNTTKGGKPFKGFRLDEDGDTTADGDTNLLIKWRAPTTENPLPFEWNTANGLGMAKFPVKGAKLPAFLNSSPGAKLKAVYY